GAQEGRDPRLAARPREARRLRQPGPEHLYPQGREEGWRALEHGRADLPGGLAVLEVQARGIPEAAGLRPQLPALQILPVIAAAALSVTGLSKEFGGLLAVDRVSLTVAPGERRAIIGPNGAGKTTLFSLISGETRPSGGQIALFGRDVTRTAPHRRASLGLARTYQITNLFPRLSALENCLLAVQALPPAKFHLHRGLHRYPAFYERARRVLDAVGLSDKEGVAVRNLSHGEQRQLEIALALAGSPRLLLLDEPTAGLS